MGSAKIIMLGLICYELISLEWEIRTTLVLE